MAVHHSHDCGAAPAVGSRNTDHQHITAASAMLTHAACLEICAVSAKTKVALSLLPHKCFTLKIPLNGVWKFHIGVIEDSSFCDVTLRVSRRFKGTCCLDLKGFSDP